MNEVDRMEETNASLWISPPTNVEMDYLNPDPSNSSEVQSESCLSSFHLEFSFISVVFRWIFFISNGLLAFYDKNGGLKSPSIQYD